MSNSDSNDYSFHSILDSTSSSDSFHDTDDLDSLLRDRFSPYEDNFNVCHINAQSVPAHYTDLHTTFSSPDIIDAILVSESWLKPSLPSASYSLSGYILIRNDRTGRGGGGVAIYLRAGLSYKVVCCSPSSYSASCEYLFIDVSFSGANILVGVVYCPPTVNYFQNLENVLDEIVPEYTHNIIMGDFNTCIINDNEPYKARASKLLNLIYSVNLSLLPTGPTHHLASSDTHLDLMFTSRPNVISCYGQLLASAFSHHDLLYASYKSKPPKYRPPTMFMRHFCRINISKLRDDAQRINWSNFDTLNNIDDMVSLFNREVLELYDRHAPIRPTKIKRAPAAWITDDVRAAMRRRDSSYRKYRRKRSVDAWDAFRVARNRCNQVCRIAKRRHFCANISNKSQSDTWKFLNTLGLGRSQCQASLVAVTPDQLNAHFASAPALHVDVKFKTLNEIAEMPTLNITPFVLSEVSGDAILKTITSITSKAIGCDGISRAMIVTIIDILLPTITRILNFSLMSGEFPTLWRSANIIPIPKISSPLLPIHFRPISILPFLSKVLESTVHKQITEFLNLNQLLNPYQSGFRAGHSTTSALLKVTEDIRNGMDETKVTVLVLIDFTNAFNTVDPDLLIAVLSRLRISPETLHWFSQYLHNRKQRVRIDQAYSSWCGVGTGVPQGGILSPLLFSLFINGITSSLHCDYHLYADDLQLYVRTDVNTLNSAIAWLNSDLSSIYSWSARYGVVVNPNKCQSIIVGSSRLLSKVDMNVIDPVRFDNVPIPFSSEVRNLGIYLDSHLTWGAQITNISRKIFSSLHSLNKLKNFLPIKAKIALVQSLLLPILDYGDVCCVDLSQEYLNKLERLHNACIRFIFGLRKFDHISNSREQLKWLPIRKRRNRRVLCLLYSLLNEPNTPKYLKNHFSYLSSHHEKILRSSSNDILTIPSHHTSFVSKSFAVVAVNLWNELPLEIRQAPNRVIFKNKVYKHYLLTHNVS